MIMYDQDHVISDYSTSAELIQALLRPRAADFGCTLWDLTAPFKFYIVIIVQIHKMNTSFTVIIPQVDWSPTAAGGAPGVDGRAAAPRGAPLAGGTCGARPRQGMAGTTKL
eukprot:COSAG02_NODE_1624_length_11594_cov_6.314833_13_plen_111_part_00